MTPQEFDVIRAAIKSAYPTFNIMPDKYSIQLWYRMLGDIDFKICETALQELIATQTYQSTCLAAGNRRRKRRKSRAKNQTPQEMYQLLNL